MKNLLTLGWIAPVLFIFGSIIFGYLLPDYSLVSQTISEIGEEGSPFQTQWLIYDLMIAILLFLFAYGVFLFSKKHQLSYIPSLFIFFFCLSQVGSSYFASPHPLHNVFGLSTTIGYFSPLIFFIFWKNSLGKKFKSIALLTFILVILGIFLNLSPLFAPNLYSMEYYGLVQRFLVYGFYIYYAYVAISTIQHTPILKQQQPT